MKTVILYFVVATGGFQQHDRTFDTIAECETYVTTKMVAVRQWACLERDKPKEDNHVSSATS